MSLLIVFLLVGISVLILRPLVKIESDPYKIGWNKINADLFKKTNKSKLPYLWVMTTNSHPQGKRILDACIKSKDLQNEIKNRTIPIWTDLLLEEEPSYFFIPLKRTFINLDPLCQVWMFYPNGKIISTWILNKSTSESITSSFIEWIKKNSSLHKIDFHLNTLHEQDVALVEQRRQLNLFYLYKQRDHVFQTLKKYSSLDNIPISACFYGLESGLKELVRDTAKKIFFTPLYDPLRHVFRNSYRWNFLWKKKLVDLSTYSEQNAEIYLLLCKIHRLYPKEGYDILAKTLLNGIKEVFWQGDGFLEVKEELQDDRGRSCYESFPLKELYQNYSLKEQEKIQKDWDLLNPSNFQKLPIQKTVMADQSLYFSLKELHPYPKSTHRCKNRVRQLRIFSRILEGSRILKDIEVQKWCLNRSQPYLNTSFLRHDLENLFGSFYTSPKIENLFSSADFHLQLFKSTKNKKWFDIGFKNIKQIYDELNCFRINQTPFLIPHYIPIKNIFAHSNESRLSRLLWSYGGKESHMFPVKQFLIDSILLQNTSFERSLSKDYFCLLERIYNYKGSNKFKCGIKEELFKDINFSTR